jgi:PAS domain S-box-containing protein
VDDQGRYTYVSPVAEEILGYKPEEMLGRFFYEFFLPDDQIFLKEAAPGVFSRREAFKNFENRNLHRDGRVVVLETSGVPFIGEDGSLLGYRGSDCDITERKRAEEALRASNQIIEGIINAIPVRVFWKDRDLVYLGCNTIFALDAGFADPKDVVGKDDYQMGWHDQAELYRGDDRQVIDSDRSKLFIEEPQTTPEGKTIVLLTSKIPLRSSEGEIIGVLGTYMDITERKRTEEALRKAHYELEMRVKERTEELSRKNAEMERFIYTVSHDLRTPLISMSGFLGFLKADAQKGDMKRMDEDLRIANDAVTKMDRLLLETLELSRIGRVVNPPEDVPFGEIVDDALRHIRSKIESKGFKVSVAQNLPVVHVDRMRITEVLSNLIENSTKYMGFQANPEIEIGQRIEGTDRIFFVRDNGIGIDPSQHVKVFELFYKVDKKSDGSGAGLAIVKKILEVHGGRIWIESKMGKGCTVCFTLPLADYQ